MKYLLLLLLAACSKPDKQIIVKTPIQSILIAGQSNAVSPAQGDFKSYYSQNSKVIVNDFYNDINDFFVPTKTRPITSSITWVILGDLLNRPVFINNIANGGTSTLQWREKYYTRIIEALRIRDYDAILWLQGESDAALKFSISQTYENMVFIITESKKIKDVQWYVALNGHTSQNTRTAQKLVIDAGFAKLGVDFDELREKHPEVWGTGQGEIDFLEGHKLHAKMWEAILK